MNISVEELLAIVIASAGGRIKIPIDDFKEVDLNNKVIAVDSMQDGMTMVLTLQDRDDINYEGEENGN